MDEIYTIYYTLHTYTYIFDYVSHSKYVITLEKIYFSLHVYMNTYRDVFLLKVDERASYVKPIFHIKP